MSIFTRIKILIKAYFAQRSGIPLTVLLEATIKTLLTGAPKGRARYNISVLPDGRTEVADIEESGTLPTDRQVLRENMGDIYDGVSQNKAVKTVAEIADHEAEIKEWEGRLDENGKKRDALLESTPDYHYVKGKSLGNRLAFLVIALSEIVAMSVVFGDMFGLDPARPSSEIYRHPVLSFLTLTFTVGFFLATLKIAEKVHTSGRKAWWTAGLLFISILIGIVRATQASALQETDMSVIFLSLLFTVVSLVFPLAAAFYAIKSGEAADIVGPTESRLRRRDEQEKAFTKGLAEATRKKELAKALLDLIVKEYVAHYQKDRAARAEARAAWERYIRYVEAYLNWTRLYYLFWAGWRVRARAVSTPVRSLAKIAAVLLVAVMLLLIGRSTAHAGDGFNMLVLCDRSSSAAEYCCTQETIEKAGNFWAQKADDVGGGRFEVLLIDKGFDTTSVLFSEIYPNRFPGPVTAHKKKWMTEFLQRLKTVTLPVNTGSAIAEAIYRSSLRLRGEGETLICVLSDMREVDKTFNFEKQVPTDKDFIAWLEANTIRPTFRGSTKVLICGLHPYTPPYTSRMTAENYDHLVKLWQAVFKKWGVRATISEDCDFENFR